MMVQVILRNGTEPVKEMPVGANLRGIRVKGIAFTSTEEIAYLLSPRGQEWLAHQVVHCFPPKSRLAAFIEPKALEQ